MGIFTGQGLTVVGIVSAIVLVSSFSLGFLLEEEEIHFSPNEESIQNDIDNLVAFGPRVTGSNAELQAAEYIRDRYIEIGLSNVQIREYQVTGTWFVDAEPDAHQILMHAQLEQGAQNAPLLPDGSAGNGRVQLESTGDLNHVEAFSFFGYSGSIHKHDNQLITLGNGSEDDFQSMGDLTDLAVIIEYDGLRPLAEIYRDGIEMNAGVLMIYTPGVESPPFRAVTVQENNQTVPFPDAYGGIYAESLIPFIYISQSTADIFHDLISKAADDDTKYAILDGFWEGSNVGTRTARVVTGELPGSGEGKIMIGAHHDSVYLGPGAVDNAIGVAHLLEIASQLKEHDLGSTIQFSTWGGEELGLLGSQAFIEQSSAELTDLDMYINLDSTNLNPSIGLGTLGIETTSNSLAKDLRVARERVFDGDWDGYSAEVIVNDGGGGSDHRAFNSAGFTTVGLYGWKYPEYHLPSDDGDAIYADGITVAPELVLHFVISQAGQSGDAPLIQIQGLEGESSSWVFPFLLALGAGLATGIGGLIVFILKEITAELMAFLLAMAAGVMLLISVVDLWFEQALEFGFITISASFLFGVSTVYIANLILSRKEDEAMLSEEKILYRSGILTAIALAIHNFPEGLAMGVAVQESAQYGVVLMAAIALHNIPEGVAVAAPIQAGNGGRFKATMIAMLTGLTEPLGALFALLVLGSFLTPFMVGCSLAFVGGIMTVVSYRELIPQALAQNRPKHMIVGALFGAAVMQTSLLLLG